MSSRFLNLLEVNQHTITSSTEKLGCLSAEFSKGKKQLISFTFRPEVLVIMRNNEEERIGL